MLKVRMLEISKESSQEELYDVGKIILCLEKDELTASSQPMRFLQDRYQRWFLELAKPYAQNPTIVVKAIMEEWAPYRIAQELGVTISGVPQL